MKTTLLAVLTALGLIAKSSAIDFGDARFGGSLTHTTSRTHSASAYTINDSAVAKGRVLGTLATVASANSSVTVRPDSTGQIKGKLVVKGTVSLDYTKSFSASLDFNPGTFVKSWSMGTKSGSYCGIPVNLTGKISVIASAKGKALVSTPLHVEGSVTPTFDLGATCTASSPASTTGSISLFKSSLPISAILTPNIVLIGGNLTVSGSQVTAKVALSGTRTKGTIRVIVTIASIPCSAILASYNGSNFGPLVWFQENVIL